MDYWIQNSDLSVASEGVVKSTQSVIDAFQSFDWEGQLKQLKRLEMEHAESCPPGFGLVREPGVILHLIPNVDGTAWGHLHTREAKKVFGFIPSTQSNVLTFDDLQTDQIPNVITKFIKGDDVWLTKTLREKD